MSVDAGYHQTRFEHDSRRETLWQSLYKYFFKRRIREEDCVIELGAISISSSAGSEKKTVSLNWERVTATSSTTW